MHPAFSSDIQQIAVCLESSVRVVCEDALCKLLAELNAFLVKTVDVPKEALEHDLVLKVGEQGAKRTRGQLAADDDAGRTAALEILIFIFVLFAAGKRHDLGRNIGAELLLAGCAFDDNIRADLVLLKAYELERDDGLALMEQLIEGVLAVCAGLAEDHRSGDVVNGLTKTIDGLAVRLHVYLLQRCREAGERL